MEPGGISPEWKLHRTPVNNHYSGYRISAVATVLFEFLIILFDFEVREYIIYNISDEIFGGFGIIYYLCGEKN